MRVRTFSTGWGKFLRLSQFMTAVIALFSTSLFFGAAQPAGADTNWTVTHLFNYDSVSMVYDGSNYVYVSDGGPSGTGGGHDVYKLDTSGNIVATLDTGADSNPSGLIIVGNYLYVTLADASGTGAIEKVDLSTFTGTKYTLSSGQVPFAIGVDGNGMLWANTGYSSNSIIEIDPTTMNVLATVVINDCSGWIYSFAGTSSTLWVTCYIDSKVIAVNLSTLPTPIETSLPLGSFSYPNVITLSNNKVLIGAAVSPAGGGILEFNQSDSSSAGSITCAVCAGASAVYPVGANYWLSENGSSVSHLIDANGNALDSFTTTNGGNFFTQPIGDNIWAATVQGIDIFRPSTAAGAPTAKSVYFGTDASQLTPGAKSTLTTFAAAVIASSTHTVHVTGFADARGSVSHNSALSLHRSQAVAAFLSHYFSAHSYSAVVTVHAGGVKHAASLALARVAVVTA